MLHTSGENHIPANKMKLFVSIMVSPISNTLLHPESKHIFLKFILVSSSVVFVVDVFAGFACSNRKKLELREILLHLFND